MTWKDYNYGWKDDFDPEHLESIEWWLSSRWDVVCDHPHRLRVARTWIPEEVDAFEKLREIDSHPAILEGGVDTDQGVIWIGFNYGD